ncbi:MAG: hypothetical protein J6334_10305, partial [Kiritimatiellae bacterium]|nr:hypothetical protein [Kiritimatiellia bacterium]
MKRVLIPQLKSRRMIPVAAALLVMAGCTSSTPPVAAPEPAPAKPRAPEVIAAEQLFEQGKIQEAIVACVDISRKKEDVRGLSELQARITQRLAEDRAEAIRRRTELATKLQSTDATRHGITPETYRQRKHVMGETASLKSNPSPMQEVLRKPVTIHLQNADLPSIVAQIGQSQNVNMIADSALADVDQMLTIHVENTPLNEVLEYIGRNMGVDFSVGSNIIWVTPKEDATSGVPMETRIYKLRKGLVGSELGRAPYGKTIFKGAEERGQSRSQDELQNGDQKEGNIGILEAIERFVPQPEGSDMIFNDKAHVLIVKNTRENLAMVEEFIDKLDIRPVQVLIEARFITTKVNDLRELGIDWLIDNRGGSRFKTDTYGQNTLASAAQFAHDAMVGRVTQVSTDDSGGGTGGLSLSYQFLLGDTALQAVLHAMEQNGESQTLAVPRVTTLNNREARFRIGTDIVYFEEVEADSTSSGYNSNNTEMTFDYDTPMTVEVGYSMTVTPSVGADLSTINLVLRPEISSIAEWFEYKIAYLQNSDIDDSKIPKIRLPSITRQFIETEATVRSGETVVLGGLVDSTKKQELTETPWLAKLPLIGNLFKVDSKKNVTQNILIFVTATLISDVGEELIPLNEIEQYGEAVPEGADVPDILKQRKVISVSTADDEETPAPAAGQPVPVPAQQPAAA